MTKELALHCRDELSQARAAVLRDSEAFPEILFALERTGAVLSGKQLGTLKAFKKHFVKLIDRSRRAGISTRNFERLYDLVHEARNEALHQGAFARHLTTNAVELALIVEDALLDGSDRIRDCMVKAPIIAHSWQPLSLVRHQMLANSFSYLPIHLAAEGWLIVADIEIARVLRSSTKNQERGVRLAASVEKARREFGLKLLTPLTVTPDASVQTALERYDFSAPIQVVGDSDELLGITTPFDLL
jgi:hypothetical protein